MKVDQWRVVARAALRELAASGCDFTADDLVAEVGFPDPGHGANASNSSIGALFNEGARQGLIVSDGRLVRSSRTHYRKRGAVRVWRGVA